MAKRRAAKAKARMDVTAEARAATALPGKGSANDPILVDGESEVEDEARKSTPQKGIELIPTNTDADSKNESFKLTIGSSQSTIEHILITDTNFKDEAHEKGLPAKTHPILIDVDIDAEDQDVEKRTEAATKHISINIATHTEGKNPEYNIRTTKPMESISTAMISPNRICQNLAASTSPPDQKSQAASLAVSTEDKNQNYASIVNYYQETTIIEESVSERLLRAMVACGTASPLDIPTQEPLINSLWRESNSQNTTYPTKHLIPPSTNTFPASRPSLKPKKLPRPTIKYTFRPPLPTQTATRTRSRYPLPPERVRGKPPLCKPKSWGKLGITWPIERGDIYDMYEVHGSRLFGRDAPTLRGDIPIREGETPTGEARSSEVIKEGDESVLPDREFVERGDVDLEGMLVSECVEGLFGKAIDETFRGSGGMGSELVSGKDDICGSS
jgi:hypothetical protein